MSDYKDARELVNDWLKNYHNSAFTAAERSEHLVDLIEDYAASQPVPHE